MGIVTYKYLFAGFGRSLSADPDGTRSKRLKFEEPGFPAVYLAYTFEDWSMATTAAHALAMCGVDIYTDWLAARLFTLDEQGELRLRIKLDLPNARLVALMSERTKDFERLRKVLDLARETMQRGRYAVLPVRFESTDWDPPPAFAEYPRIELHGHDLVFIAPNSTYHLPLRRWFRPEGSSPQRHEDTK